jgi:hypothetical protein
MWMKDSNFIDWMMMLPEVMLKNNKYTFKFDDNSTALHKYPITVLLHWLPGIMCSFLHKCQIKPEFPANGFCSSFQFCPTYIYLKLFAGVSLGPATPHHMWPSLPTMNRLLQQALPKPTWVCNWNLFMSYISLTLRFPSSNRNSGTFIAFSRLILSHM